MSLRYKGAVISATPPTTSTSSASGAWTLEQQMQAQGAGNWPFGGPFNYIEDVFSTYLYTGNGTSQTITNNIDLSTNGGLVWTKSRGGAEGTFNHIWIDTVRGGPWWIASNQAAAASYDNRLITSFNTNGYSFGTGASTQINYLNSTYASWTFRKQPKFFDVVTYTGTGSTQNIAHSLGSVPGCIIVKKTSGAASWCVYHTSLGNAAYINLNLTDAASTSQYSYFYGGPSSTTFTVGAASDINESGQTFVAYLFAHNAGGFGLTSTDNVISCGSLATGAGGGGTVNLGYEPQWLIVKSATATSYWYMFDSMRGWSQIGAQGLRADGNGAEFTFGNSSVGCRITSTGFTFINGTLPANETWIYIAIRRGPMKVPTSGTSVFAPSTSTQTSGALVTSGFPVDAFITATRNASPAGFNSEFYGRLQGGGYYLKTSATDAEAYSGVPAMFQYNTGVAPARFDNQPLTLMFQRAPSFFDEVCYSGNSTQTAYTHNLGVAPELVIVKVRNTSGESWPVWCVYGTQKNSWAAVLEGANPYQARGQNMWGTDPDAAPSMTATTFRLGNNTNVNQTGYTYVAYLFATCAGVSKVGSYTGTGATQTISCGFTGGARFVLIKRTDSTGSWFVWDTARGMVSGTDPRLALNSTAAESNADWVYTTTGGFQIVTTDANVNASGGTYIYLAIA